MAQPKNSDFTQFYPFLTFVADYTKNLVWLLGRLCSRAAGVVGVGGGHPDQFPFEKGVRLGCVVSPLLFNACGEAILRQVQETLDGGPGGIVGGGAVWSVRCADDVALLARSGTGLEGRAVELEECGHAFGLHVDSAGTHVVVHGGDGLVFLGGSAVSQVDRFECLGSVVGVDGDSAPEICAGLAVAGDAAGQLAGLWKGGSAWD